MATVVGVKGSAPRHVGAKMLVLGDGTIEGTIGGGELERRVIDEAMRDRRLDEPRLTTFVLDGKRSLQVCGGQVDVFFEPVVPSKRIVIAGGGHIGLALSVVVKLLNYQVIVLDHRRDFVSRSRFPHADQLICRSYASGMRSISPDETTAVVIVTHGHAHDEVCLEAALRSQAGYIGMIGSRSKKKMIWERMRKKGFSSADLGRVHTPVGLDIGAETPAQIAVSIAAELIRVWDQGVKNGLKSQYRDGRER